MKTIENNKLLAEFLGWGNRETTKVYFNINGTANDLNFEKDWNRLMLVVTHIERNLPDEFFVVILEEECNIYQKYQNGIKLDTPKEIVSIDCKDEKIDAVYEACVYFANWFETNKFIFNNGDLNLDIEMIKLFDAPITVQMTEEPTFDCPYALDIEDRSYWYANEKDCVSDYNKLKEVCPHFTFV